MSPHIIALLRLLHIVAGAFLVGIAIFNAFFLFPAVRKAGPAGGQVMGNIATSRFPMIIGLSQVTLFGSGLLLMYIVSVHFSSEWMRSRFGMAIMTGALCAFVAAGIGGAMASKNLKKIGKLSSGGPPSPEVAAEIARAQGTLQAALRVVAILMIVAASAMAVARYL